MWSKAAHNIHKKNKMDNYPFWKKYVGRIFSILCFTILLFCMAYPAVASYYWDYPRYIERNKEKTIVSDVKPVDIGQAFLVFYLEQGTKSARINFKITEDFRTLSDPKTAQGDIALKKGFSPHFDVFYTNDTLFLVWNTLDGLLRYSTSTDRGSTWQKDIVLVRDENFCFRPLLFYENNTLYLFYHIESEGTRIDFFYISSRNLGKTWTSPFQVAKGFAGSFFPSLHYHRGRLYIFWQSRPIYETETPVFNIYYSMSTDQGATWSIPRSLAESKFGENAHPVVFFTQDRFHVLYKGDRGGVTGIYYREYGLLGDPISEEQKVNQSLSTAMAPSLLVPDNQLLVFYLDGRDGNTRIYYSQRQNGSFVEDGPFGVKGRDILRFFPFMSGKLPYLFWQDRVGIGFLGPDESIASVRVNPVKNRYIGKSGLKVSWSELKDSSGLEGYCYSFNKEKIEEPEIVNLSPFTNSITLTAGEEGTYYFHLRAKDRAGNYSSTETIPFSIDLTPPPSPVLSALELDKDGFYKDNSPLFQWIIDTKDVVGYNYSLSKKKISITRPRIRTTRNRVKYSSIDEGVWYFNVAAVDRAGNVGNTTHFRLRLHPLPTQPEVERKIVKLAPPWILKRETFEISPVLNIALYLVLGGLLVITVFIFTDVILKLMARREGVTMEEKISTTGIRKKRFGLRFKFSLLIVALILILTIGISSILSYVSTENQKRALADQMIAKARLSLENMTNVAREGILNNDELLLLSVIAKTMENEDIKYSIILDNSNRVIAHSDINERGKVLEDRFTERTAKASDIVIDPGYNPDELKELYKLASPVIFAETRLGTVQLGYSTDSIFRTILEARRNNLYSAMIVTGVTILVGILGAILMASITIKPIKVLAKGANIIGEGRLDYKIHIKARDEIGLLSDEFNRMTERLLDYQKKMEEKAKLDEQLEIARRIQQDLIPQMGIENDFVSIDGYYKAAVGVGGDYYDFLQIGGERYGLIISDVAGKGVPASLMMIMIRTVFKSLLNSGVSDPGRLVTLMNDTLAADISSDRFATLLFGVFDQKNRQFRYTNAGYGPILVYKSEKNQCFLVNPPEGSVPIGVMPDVEYAEENPIVLSSGDSLFLFTDGIHEARNEREEEYGMRRLADIIPSFADRDSKEMANLIVEDVSNFVGSAEQYDDMTLTVMKVK